LVLDTEKHKEIYQKKKTVVGSEARGVNKHKNLQHKVPKCNGTITIFQMPLPFG
jgi:hypothetical protein